jgi:hypothetical protein
MRSSTLSLGLGWALGLLVSGQAVAGATLLVPDFSDPRNPLEGIRARAEILRALGGYEAIQIAPLSKLKKLAHRHHLKPTQLATSQAASVLGRYEGLDGVLSGVVVDRAEPRLVRLVLYDPTGVAAFKTDLALSDGAISPKSAETAAKGIARALGVSTPPRPAANAGPPAGMAPPPSGGEAVAAQGGSPPVAADNRSPPPGGDDRYPPSNWAPGGNPGATAGQGAPGASDGGSPTGAAAEPPPTEPGGPPRSGEPLFQFGLSLPLSLHDFSLTDPDLTPATFLTYDTGSPYIGVAADFALFPFAHLAYGLQGLGLLGSFSLGFINNSYTDAEGTTTPFKSQDLRAGGDLTYRLHLRAIKDAAGADAIYNPSFGVRVGFSYFDYSVDPDNPAGLQPIVRTPIKVGLDYLQPIGSWLRLGLGGEVYLLAGPGAAEEAEYGSTSSLGWGVHFTAGGLFGLAGLGYQVKLDYLDFSDRYDDATAAVPGISSGVETYLDLWIGLTYAIQ